jgi:hypothetical protein
MHFFGMVLWIAVLWFAFSAFRRWNSCGSRGFRGDRPLERREGLDDQQPYIDALESRVAELEQRLDFTERLVAERRESVSS